MTESGREVADVLIMEDDPGDVLTVTEAFDQQSLPL
jgi:hypothetical protein